VTPERRGSLRKSRFREKQMVASRALAAKERPAARAVARPSLIDGGYSLPKKRGACIAPLGFRYGGVGLTPLPPSLPLG